MPGKKYFFSMQTTGKLLFCGTGGVFICLCQDLPLKPEQIPGDQTQVTYLTEAGVQVLPKFRAMPNASFHLLSTPGSLSRNTSMVSLSSSSSGIERERYLYCLVQVPNEEGCPSPGAIRTQGLDFSYQLQVPLLCNNLHQDESLCYIVNAGKQTLIALLHLTCLMFLLQAEEDGALEAPVSGCWLSLRALRLFRWTPSSDPPFSCTPSKTQELAYALQSFNTGPPDLWQLRLSALNLHSHFILFLLGQAQSVPMPHLHSGVTKDASYCKTVGRSYFPAFKSWLNFSQLGLHGSRKDIFSP